MPHSHLCVSKYWIKDYFEMHWHEFYEVEFVLSGQGTNIINGILYPIKKGSIIFLTPADFHQVLADSNSSLEVYNVKFSEGLLKEPLRKLLFHANDFHVGNIKIENFNQMQMEFERLKREYLCDEIGADMIIRGAIERILIDAMRSANTDGNFKAQLESGEKKFNPRYLGVYIISFP